MSGSASSSSSLCPFIPATPLLSFLQRLQSTALRTRGTSNFDPKHFVDRPLKFDLSTTEAAFSRLPRAPDGSVAAEDLDGFVEKYLRRPGSDMLEVDLVDLAPEPEAFLPRVESSEVRAWALEVHSLWRMLSRKISDEVKGRRDLHTLLALPGPFIVPGSRFGEAYYWDSYWIIRGLLASKMYDTAKSMVINLLSLIDEYGFVLNGARSYYTNRSHPPLLSSMIREIYNRTDDLALVKKAFPLLVKEHHFWNSGIHKVIIQDAEGLNHVLSRYYAMWNKPRPESATFDEESASRLQTDPAKEEFYRELASAAESGWDFSTRWLRNPSDFTTLATTSIVPVDLNAYLLKMELDIAFFAKHIGDDSAAEKFSQASDHRHAAMKSIFWDDEMNQWLDYWLNDSTCKGAHIWKVQNQNKRIFASNFIPLWIYSFYPGEKRTGLFLDYCEDGALVEKVVRSLQNSGLIRDAGIVTSLSNSGQQWDFPNGWAPLQHMIVEGLVRSGSREARILAEDIAMKWIRTNYAAYKKTNAMHEKYNVEACGKSGGGGEHETQTGFGWSNGVVLALLEEFGWPQIWKIGC